MANEKVFRLRTQGYQTYYAKKGMRELPVLCSQGAADAARSFRVKLRLGCIINTI
jgi:hypothetical protein